MKFPFIRFLPVCLAIKSFVTASVAAPNAVQNGGVRNTDKESGFKQPALMERFVDRK